MKITSVILSVILIFNSVFYYISLSVRIIEAKSDAKEKLSERGTNKDLMLIKIPSKDAKGEKEKELWFNDKLYDIVFSKTINDTVYYYASADHEEEEALSIIDEHFNTERDSINPGNPKCIFHKIQVKSIDQYCLNFYNQNLFKNSLLFVFKMPVISCSTGSHKVLTPPPRYDLISNFDI